MTTTTTTIGTTGHSTVEEVKLRSNEINIDLSLKKFEESADLTDSTTTDPKSHVAKHKRYKKRLKPIRDETITDASPEKEFSPTSDHSSSETDSNRLKKTSEIKADHKSFQVINEEASFQVIDENLIPETKRTKSRSSSKLEQISSPDTLIIRSRSVSREKDRNIQSSCETHISLPLLPEKTRSESNLSAPHLGSMYSDNEQKTDSNSEELDVVSSAGKKKKFKKRSKARLGTKSAGSDYESSVLIDSGFEPSPRSSRIPKRKVMTERSVNMTSVTQSIQTNIRR